MVVVLVKRTTYYTKKEAVFSIANTDICWVFKSFVTSILDDFDSAKV
jgi:hypothetical protein